MINKQTALLPNGLLDLLPPHAEAESHVIETFMKSFAAFGYARVKPPLVEFEESLLGEGPGQALSRQTFRMMDPVSQRMMGVRADATAQIARIATSRLGDSKRPLRLSYAADVLRVNGTQLRPERQFCQVGCELIGADGIMADVESPLIALIALASAGIGQLSVDLTVPTLTDHLFDALGTPLEKREAFESLIEKRDRDAALAAGGEEGRVIAALMDVEGGETRALDKIAGLRLPGKAQADADHLAQAARELRAALDIYGLSHVQITLDPLERRGFEYQTGLSFTLFAHGARGELGRGGRYDITRGGKALETATGFTLYMDTILRVAPPQEHPPAQDIAADAGWAEVKALQDKGLNVTRRTK